MDKKKLIALLQSDLEKEYAAFNFYLQCSFTVRGYRRGYLKEWLKKQAEEELGHASEIAEKISSLGATPSNRIPPMNGLKNAMDILKQARAYELDVVKRFAERARQAEEFGDLHLKLMLEEQGAESQAEAEEIRKLIEEV